jgi:hypothetical protein
MERHAVDQGARPPEVALVQVYWCMASRAPAGSFATALSSLSLAFFQAAKSLGRR